MSFKREVFEKVGLFDVRLGSGALGFSDDTEYSMRIRRAGFKVGYAPGALFTMSWIQIGMGESTIERSSIGRDLAGVFIGRNRSFLMYFPFSSPTAFALISTGS